MLCSCLAGPVVFLAIVQTHAALRHVGRVSWEGCHLGHCPVAVMLPRLALIQCTDDASVPPAVESAIAVTINTEHSSIHTLSHCSTDWNRKQESFENSYCSCFKINFHIYRILVAWKIMTEPQTKTQSCSYWKDKKRVLHLKKKHTCGFGPLANYADRATAAYWRSSTNFCG
jgi:hypothetical protein